LLNNDIFLVKDLLDLLDYLLVSYFSNFYNFISISPNKLVVPYNEGTSKSSEEEIISVINNLNNINLDYIHIKLIRLSHLE